MQKAKCYRELEVWKKSKKLVINIYKMTSFLPMEDKYSLADQIRRAAISIPSNIAEGQQRYSIKEFIRFTSISKGSVAELITQLEIVSELYPELEEHVMILLTEYNLLGRKLNNLLSYLKTKANNKISQLKQ